MADNKEQNSLDDLLFEGKNKEYGAYEIRKKESKYLLRAFIIGASTFGVIVLGLFVLNVLFASEKEPIKEYEIEIPPIEEVVEEEPEELKPQEVTTVPEERKQEEFAQVNNTEAKVNDNKPETIVVPDKKDEVAQGTENISSENKSNPDGQTGKPNPNGSNNVQVGIFDPNSNTFNGKDLSVLDKVPMFKAGGKKTIEQQIQYSESSFSAFINNRVSNLLMDYPWNGKQQHQVVIRMTVGSGKNANISDARVIEGSLGKEIDAVIINAVKKAPWAQGAVYKGSKVNMPVKYRVVLVNPNL